jgi:hypothetical protein
MTGQRRREAQWEEVVCFRMLECGKQAKTIVCQNWDLRLVAQLDQVLAEW